MIYFSKKMSHQSQWKKNKELANQIHPWPHEHFNNEKWAWMDEVQIAESFLVEEKNKIDFAESKWEIVDQLKDILVINVANDMELSKKQTNILPIEIQRYLHPSWNASWRYYILNYANGSSRTFVGYGGGSQWRLTDWVMQSFLKKLENEPKLKSILRKKILSLKELYKEII